MIWMHIKRGFIIMKMNKRLNNFKDSRSEVYYDNVSFILIIIFNT